MRQQKTQQDAMRRSNWNQGCCAHCKGNFKKKTTWQKFCGEDCRKAAYEQHSGRIWRNKNRESI